MSEKVKVLGVDPSLRFTGLALLTYDTETKEINVSHCQTLVNPQKYKGKDAILNMLDMLQDCADTTPEYTSQESNVIESPAVLFNKAWSGGTMALIAHISGGAAVIFGLQKSHFFRPNEWNKSRKKEVTHAQAFKILGTPEKWHFQKMVKNENHLEHIYDAACLALFWLKNIYIDEEEPSE